MFTNSHGLILIAISSAPHSCPIPEIYWRTDYFGRIVPTAGEIRAAVEIGLSTGLLGYRNERLFLAEPSRSKIIELAKAAGTADTPQAVASWLSEQFPERVRKLSFELKEEKGDDSFRYGISSVEWRILEGSSEITEVSCLK